MICIVETFLRDNEVIELPGYRWYGQNRTVLHSRAVRGSGGIGCFVKLDLLQYFDCSVIDNDHEGILILQLCNKISGFRICLYVVYLPPERSVRGRNSDDFFEYLLTKTYAYSDHDLSILLGDFNARVGNKTDYVVDVDDDSIPVRVTIDDGVNKHVESLIDFCIDSKFVIANGRVTPDEDNFTFVSSRGRSVVDYIITPQSDLNFFTAMKVMIVSDILNEFALTPPEGGTEGHLPDHSVVCAEVKVHYYKEQEQIQIPQSVRYNTRNIPNDFMNTEELMQTVVNTIDVIENSQYNQQNINEIYDKVCDIFHVEMNNKLLISNTCNVKRRTGKRVPKPWWCDLLELT
jgi:hypothetical protein